MTGQIRTIVFLALTRTYDDHWDVRCDQRKYGTGLHCTRSYPQNKHASLPPSPPSRNFIYYAKYSKYKLRTIDQSNNSPNVPLDAGYSTTVYSHHLTLPSLRRRRYPICGSTHMAAQGVYRSFAACVYTPEISHSKAIVQRDKRQWRGGIQVCWRLELKECRTTWSTVITSFEAMRRKAMTDF